jgi:hypothetical protein
MLYSHKNAWANLQVIFWANLTPFTRKVLVLMDVPGYICSALFFEAY